jgi:hypothetical protein
MNWILFTGEILILLLLLRINQNLKKLDDLSREDAAVKEMSEAIQRAQENLPPPELKQVNRKK